MENFEDRVALRFQETSNFRDLPGAIGLEEGVRIIIDFTLEKDIRRIEMIGLQRMRKLAPCTIQEMEIDTEL